MAIELGKVNVTDLVENDYKILGIGINKSSNKGGIFTVNYTTLTQAKDNLKNLILTRKGERLMQPEFGCDIYNLLFEQIHSTDDFENRIESIIESAVKSWLPYINIDRINYIWNDNNIDNHIINLEIKFSLLSNPNLSESTTIIVNTQ
jgi:phage baseplate assembly protein W